MNGWHLTAEMRGCSVDAPRYGDLMRDASALRRLCVEAVATHRLHAVGELFHAFAAGSAAAGQGQGSGEGVTGVVLLAESHLAVHTWPEHDAVTLDVFVCNLGRDNSAAAERLMADLVAAFAPRQCTRRTLDRGVVVERV